jgi:hypothetical protein
MVRLTADLILNAAQYTNPVRERELDLRGSSLHTFILYSFYYMFYFS